MDTSIVMIIDRHGRKAEWPQMSKMEIADKLFDRILAMISREENKKPRTETRLILVITAS